MQVLSEAYSNFVNSINSDQTKQVYEYSLNKFLNHYQMDLDSFLKLSQQEMSDFVINYLANMKISRQYKTVILSAIKHACEMNDVLLNWKRLKKFIKSEKTDNAINGKDRGYTDGEIRKILEFSDQRLRTAFLILASTGCRVGALQLIKVGDLERIDNLYKIIIYCGDNEEYLTFCTPEAAKAIDSYLDYRTRRGEVINQDSYLLVKKFRANTKVKGEPFKGKAFGGILQDCIDLTGVREIDGVHRYKRKQIPIIHGFRKFFTECLVDSKLNPEIREMLLGHKIGLASAYYKPTEQEMLNEYLKAVNLLTINEENRLRKKVETLTIEKSQFESLKHDFELFKKELRSKR